MILDAALNPAEVVLHFPEEPWRGRLASYLRGLARPRSLLVLAGLAVLPSLVVEAAMSGDAAGLRTFDVALGAGACLLVVVCGALAAAVQRVAASTLTFTEGGIRRESRGAITEHGWDWIVDFTEENGVLEIVVPPPPMRSFQLARPEPQLLLLTRESVGDETIAALRALLEAHARGQKPRRGPRGR